MLGCDFVFGEINWVDDDNESCGFLCLRERGVPLGKGRMECGAFSNGDWKGRMCSGSLKDRHNYLEF